jgi:hypothetical protein
MTLVISGFQLPVQFLRVGNVIGELYFGDATYGLQTAFTHPFFVPEIYETSKGICVCLPLILRHLREPSPALGIEPDFQPSGRSHVKEPPYKIVRHEMYGSKGMAARSA